MVNNIKNVLVPISFSKASFNAVGTAIEICKRHGATLHLLHVTPQQYLYPTASMQAPVFTMSEVVLEKDIENTEAYAKSVRNDHDVYCIAHNEIGNVPLVVSKIAKEIDSDLVVIAAGTDGNALYGNNSSNVIRMCDCPVLSVPPKKVIKSFKNVLFPVRLAANAIGKYQFAEKIFAKNKSTVKVVGAIKKNETQSYNLIKKLVGNLENLLTDANVNFSSEYRFSNNIPKSLADAARNTLPDLIVITPTTGRGWRRLFSSNYTQEIIKHFDTAILCVKPVGVKNATNMGMNSIAYI